MQLVNDSSESRRGACCAQERGGKNAKHTMAFNFGAPAATTNPPAGFSFSTSSSGSDAATKVGFNFGGAAPASANPSTTTTTTAPKASTGFSFGGPSAPAAATTPPAPAFGGGLFNLSGGGGEDSSSSSSSTSNKKKAPSGSGFSFGGLSAATTTTNDGGSSSQATPVSKLGGGAGFGGGLFGLTPGTTPAARVPPPVETPNTVVGDSSAVSSATPGVSTPATSAISPPATAAAPASQSTTTTTTDTAPKMIEEPPPVEYQTLTVEQILNRFQSELETDAIAFLSEAQRVAHYDATLRDSQASLSELANAVSRLMLHQTEVNAQLQGIGSYQDELSKTLDLLERNVDELFAGRSNIRVEDADIDRERSYERAIDVDNKLDSMCSTLRHVVNDLDAAQERFWSSTLRSNGEGGDDEVGKIIGVFNAHHETLGHLESKARSLESDLTMISQVLAKSGQ